MSGVGVLAGRHQPRLDVITFLDSDTPTSSQSQNVALIPLAFGLDVRPVQMSSRNTSLAIGAQVMRLNVTGVPAEAGITVSGSWGFGVGRRF